VRRLTNPQIGLFLALFGALALGLNGYNYWRTGALDSMMLIPTVGLLAMLAAMPFLAGWRTSEKAPGGFVACASCATLWSPRDDRTAFCPGCGKVPKTAEASFQKHPYASALR
jgi:hypothetical protein